MKDELRNEMLNGKDIYQWHAEKVKQNNKCWFWILVLFCILFIGHAVIRHSVFVKIQEENKQKDSVIKYQKTVIGIQDKCLDSAVYFKDILLNK
mgnify:CR=1 FL=1